jgi:hypothetical protein
MDGISGHLGSAARNRRAGETSRQGRRRAAQRSHLATSLATPWLRGTPSKEPTRSGLSDLTRTTVTSVLSTVTQTSKTIEPGPYTSKHATKQETDCDKDFIRQAEEEERKHFDEVSEPETTLASPKVASRRRQATADDATRTSRQ